MARAEEGQQGIEEGDAGLLAKVEGGGERVLTITYRKDRANAEGSVRRRHPKGIR